MTRVIYGTELVAVGTKPRLLYELYDKDGTVLFTGNSDECAKYMHCTREDFHHYKYHQSKGRINGDRGALLVRKVDKDA